ncbi:OmpA family protein [Montanilutibacter psychrotolerans]|uniref:OmpA family protein n=1 Tax=Montanilutibacter psychrotolerans TaxID=1327343 RepID=A0A3M8SSR5_9GAMM|nr:OmpA family protein [Lysobacter psychrotolerans]RNF84368.1 OmpA family protein [Lysobacter psychrotolerans]
MNARPLLLALLLAPVLGAQAQTAPAVDAVTSLNQRLSAVEAEAQASGFAAFERLQARHAVDALAASRGRDRDAALYVAERRVEIAQIAARSQATQREVDRLDRERGELLVEASRRDAERARAEAERLRIAAQVQAEEAARLRQQTLADAEAMQDVEAALQGATGAQAAKLAAAREKEAALAREEAELLAGGGRLPASRHESRGEVFTLAGDAFGSGQATLTAAAAGSVRALAAYVKTGGGAVRIEGHTDSDGNAAGNLALSQRRADAVRDALVAAGVPRSRVQAVGRGQAEPVADNGSAAGRARNRRVEVIVPQK